MRIFLACPAPPHSRKGNRVTAVRWARLLRELGHRATVGTEYAGDAADVMVALHARRSAAAAERFRRRWQERPLIVALTGTDLYRDIHTSKEAQESLAIADRLVVLQPQALAELPTEYRGKARVIYQSVRPLPKKPAQDPHAFQVCVLGHLREEKDPLRAALAVRLLPADSRVRVVHAGQALSSDWARRAAAARRRDPRYRWLGEVPRWRARRILARSRLLVLSSRMEGGANVISEAVVEGVPVLASRIPGSVGLLGARYPGLYPVGDTEALARLMHRAETDSAYYGRLLGWCRRLAARFDPAKERAAWERLLAELVLASGVA